MFNFGEIIIYPTDTSFGCGVRADDSLGLSNLVGLKNRATGNLFSLMVKDFAMLQEFAVIPANFSREIFSNPKTPITILLPPTNKLPKTPFWSQEKVAWRICTIPEIANQIDFPVTACRIKKQYELVLFSLSEIEQNFCTKNIKKQYKVKIYNLKGFTELPITSPSEIWDYTLSPAKRLR